MQAKYILRNCLLRYEKKTTSFWMGKVCLAWKKTFILMNILYYMLQGGLLLQIVLPKALGKEPPREKDSVKWEK